MGAFEQWTWEGADLVPTMGWETIDVPIDVTKAVTIVITGEASCEHGARAGPTLLTCTKPQHCGSSSLTP